MTKKVPIQLQTEISECGAACIAMIAQYFELDIDLVSLRRHFPQSIRGTNLLDLVRIARALDFEAEAFRLELNNLSELAVPCILHWDFNHFVVLTKVSETHVEVNDPALGQRVVSMQEFSDRFTGVALVLRPAPAFKPRKARATLSLSSLAGKILGLRRDATFILVFAGLLECLTLLTPLFLQLVVDQIALTDDRELLFAAGIAFLVLTVMSSAIASLRSWLIISINLRMRYQWFINVFSHLIRLPLAFFERRQVGDVLSRFNAIASIQRIIGASFIEAILDGFFSAFAIGAMFYFAGSLAFICIAVVTLYVVLRSFTYDSIKRATEACVIHTAKQESHFLETIRSTRGIRLFGREQQRQFAWQRHLSLQAKADGKLQARIAFFNVASSLLFGAGKVALVWVGALAVLDTKLTVGALIAALFYADQVHSRAASLVDKFVEFRTIRVYIDRLADILLTEKESYSVQSITGKPITEIEFRNVFFRYSDSEPVVLDNVSFRVSSGESVAIAGPSGCGKTTILKLILGILKPTIGEIYLNGQRSSQVSRDDLIRSLGVVMQDDGLLAGNLFENISFFDISTNYDRVVECAKAANIHEEIESFAMGYHTLLGEMGTSLSGGQVQRILLARALYNNPSLLILDEATSHLDNYNESCVNDAIRSIGITRLIVAHRETTINSADRTIHMEHGRIVKSTSPSNPEISQPRALLESIGVRSQSTLTSNE